MLSGLEIGNDIFSFISYRGCNWPDYRFLGLLTVSNLNVLEGVRDRVDALAIRLGIAVTWQVFSSLHHCRYF